MKTFIATVAALLVTLSLAPAKKHFPVVPAGAVVSVELLEPVDSEKNDPGDTFKGRLSEPLESDSVTVAPAGADVKVRMVNIPQYHTTHDVDDFALELVEITIDGKKYPVTSGFAETTAGFRKVRPGETPEGTTDVDDVVSGLAAGDRAVMAVARGSGVSFQVVRGPGLDVSANVILNFKLAEHIAVRPEEAKSAR